MIFLPCFVAPEILSGEAYTHVVDWWSLGVVMFTLLVGKVTLSLFI